MKLPKTTAPEPELKEYFQKTHGNNSKLTYASWYRGFTGNPLNSKPAKPGPERKKKVILDENKEVTTPKKAAQALLDGYLTGVDLDDLLNNLPQPDKLTDRETTQILEQLNKLIERMKRVL